MTDQERKAMQMALEALEYADSCLKKQLTTKTKHEYAQDLLMTAGTALRQALAQPEQEHDYGIDRGAWADVENATKWVDELRGDDESEQEPVAWWTGKEKSEDEDFMYPKTRQAHIQHPNSATANFYSVPLYTAPVSKPDDLLRQSEQEGWRWAKECEAEVKRLRTLLAEGGQGCSECGVTVGEGYALYCVKCVEPLFAKEWVSLTDEERKGIREWQRIQEELGPIWAPMKEFARAIEAALKEKNNV